MIYVLWFVIMVALVVDTTHHMPAIIWMKSGMSTMIVIVDKSSLSRFKTLKLMFYFTSKAFKIRLFLF